MACSTGFLAFKGERSERDPRRYIVGSWRGSDRRHQRGPAGRAGAPEERRCEGKKSPQKWYPVCGDHRRALALLLWRSHQSPCSGRMCDGPHCTSAVAPQVPCGGIWPFGDLSTGAHQLAGARSSALPSCGAHSHQSTTPRARIDGQNRCTRRPT
jgi:hypothetical protein